MGRHADVPVPITPPLDQSGRPRAHCFCATCGLVLTVLSDHAADLPWCAHTPNCDVMWHPGIPESGRTQMRPAVVFDAAGEPAADEIAAAAARMRSWAHANPQCDSQGIIDSEWDALARAALNVRS